MEYYCFLSESGTQADIPISSSLLSTIGINIQLRIEKYENGASGFPRRDSNPSDLWRWFPKGTVH